MSKKNNLFIKISVVIAYLAMITTNSLANIIPLNGVTTGEVSNNYPNLFAPSAFTFSIWGLIYLMLGFYSLYQFGFFRSKEDADREVLFKKIGINFIFSSIANTLWIFSWHFDVIGLSLLCIVAILFFLIKIANILNKEKFSLKEKVFILFPFSIYFGWITVATIANVTVFLVSIGWDRFGLTEQTWTIVALLAGTIIGSLRMFKDRNVAYGLVLIWAYLGILAKHLSEAGFAVQYNEIIIATIFCLFVFLSGLFFTSKRI